jgi:hypothetical protein
VWAFTFTGSGKSKYANELLELTCNFEFEYSEELKTAILNNWLCNLSGLDGCWFPLDLLQEKNIKQLKQMAQPRNAAFDGSFFQDVISLNVQAFLDAIASMKTAVRLSKKGGAHRRTEKNMDDLKRNIEEQGMHKFHAGRTSTHVAKNDFKAGYEILADGKRIKEFIVRTLRDAGAIHRDNDPTNDPVDNTDRDLPMPNMLIDGCLVNGAEELETNDLDLLGGSSTDSEDSDTGESQMGTDD